MKKDEVYQKALAKQQEVYDMLDELNLTAEQKSVVNQAITANNHFSTIYGAVAYRFGMEDGIKLRAEMEEIVCFPQ